MSRGGWVVPFAIAGAVFIAWIGVSAYVTYQQNNGHLVYAMDDPYIHMAMARNLAEHGVFGVTRYEFSSSTSSPLWTLLLAASYRIVGVEDWIPGFWAALSALLCLLATSLLCRRLGLGIWGATVTCLLVLTGARLTVLTALGMEHVLHAALILSFLVSVFMVIEAPTRRALALSCATALLAVGVRYESLFVVLPLAAVMFLHRRRAAAILVIASAFVVPLAFGLYLVYHGAYPLPSSVLLKGVGPRFGTFQSLVESCGGRAVMLLTKPRTFAAVVPLMALAVLVREVKPVLRWVSLGMVAAYLLHLQFAQVGKWGRYEGYLFALAIALSSAMFPPAWRQARGMITGARRWSALAAAVVAAAGIALLSVLGLYYSGRTVTACANIYQQQYQMGRFAAEELGCGARVAVNDLGAITYYADIRVLDLIGLGSLDVARARLDRCYGTAAIAELLRTHGIEYVVVYRTWFKGWLALPEGLIEIGRWTIPDNVICGDATVFFFATSEENAKRLADAFARFTPKLPRGVLVEQTMPPQADARTGPLR